MSRLIVWDKVTAQNGIEHIALRGCPLSFPCPGCQVRDTKTGRMSSVFSLAAFATGLYPETDQVVIEGGEPFTDSVALAELVALLVGTGAQVAIRSCAYTLEDLEELGQEMPEIRWLLANQRIVDRDGIVSEGGERWEEETAAIVRSALATGD